MKQKRGGRLEPETGRKSWPSFQYTIRKNLKPIFDKKTGLHKKRYTLVADVAAAMNCTRSEAVQRLASIMPDLLRIQKCTDGKNAAWLDCISIYEQQELAYNKPTQEDYYGIRPE